MEIEQPYDEWEKSVPEKLKADPLWKSSYYRLGMYLYDLVWLDCSRMRRDFRGRSIGDQLIRSAGAICANVEEAFGRGVGTADYVRILRIALGEARETQGWYFRARHILPADLIDRRLSLITQVVALLVSTISQHKNNLARTVNRS